MYNYLKNRTLLYIEDDVDVLQNISSFMQNYFASVHMAADAEIGFEIFNSKPIDLLIVDIELPGINGIEFIKKVRKVNATIPIVVVSAYTNTDYLLESVELKIDKYIVKPFTSKKIYSLLDKIDLHFKENNTLVFNTEITLYSNNHSFIFHGNRYSLTSKEFKFLKLLSHQGFVHYNDLTILWEGKSPSQGAIRSFIQHLRKKLPHNTIKNRQDIGYYV